MTAPDILAATARRLLWKARLAFLSGNVDRMERLFDRYVVVTEWAAAYRRGLASAPSGREGSREHRSPRPAREES